MFFVIKSLPDGGTKGCETQEDWQRKALIFLFTQNHLKTTLYIIKVQIKRIQLEYNNVNYCIEWLSSC